MQKLFWQKNWTCSNLKGNGSKYEMVEVAPSKNEFTTFVSSDKINIAKQRDKCIHPIWSTRDINGTYEQMANNEVEVVKWMEMPYGRMFSLKTKMEMIIWSEINNLQVLNLLNIYIIRRQ